MLRGVRNLSSTEQDTDDVQLLKRDLSIRIEDDFPYVQFFEKVHQILYQGMSLTVIIKLLGRKIGFRALSNKIYHLWKPSTLVKIMDMKNNYFMVKFQEESNYIRALTKGPWIVFGQYLTVQP